MLNLVELSPHLKIKTHSDLLELPRVVRVNNFSEECAAKFVKEISAAHETGQEIIPIVIDSFGGDVYSLLTMIDAVKSAKLPIATIVEGKAMSCGAVLLTCGQEGMRFSAPNATVMIHGVSNFAGWKKVEDLKADTKEAERLNELLFKTMAENCGKASSYFLDILLNEKKNTDWFLSAKEAKEHNVVNFVRVPSFKTVVTVKTVFE